MMWIDDMLNLTPEDYEELKRQMHQTQREFFDLDIDQTTIARRNPDGSYTKIISLADRMQRFGPYKRKIRDADVDGGKE